MSHLSDIGFRLSQEQYADLAMHAARQGQVLPGLHGTYIQWSPGEGIELWIQANKKKELIGCNPHFSGVSRMQMGVLHAIAVPEHPMDGCFYGWANPRDPKDPSSGDYLFAVDLPDFDFTRKRLPLPAIVTMQITAFAHTLICYPDVAGYYGAQRSGPRFATKSFAPASVLESQEDLPRAEAMFNGHIRLVERRLNPATNLSFYYLAVDTLGGMIDVVADRELIEGEPKVGGIASGTFWLSGRVMSDLLAPEKQSLLRRRRV